MQRFTCVQDAVEALEGEVSAISLRGVDIGQHSQKLLQAVKGCASLEELDLARTRTCFAMVTGIAKVLTESKSLVTLRLNSNPIGHRGTERLCQALLSSSLMTLSLVDTGIGPRGASHLSALLSRNGALTDLELGNNEIGPEGACRIARSLKENSTLQTLRLVRNKIQDKGAAAFGDLLEANSSLLRLSLDRNAIGDAGAAKLAHGVQHSLTLKGLELGGNVFSEKGVKELLEALYENSSVVDFEISPWSPYEFLDPVLARNSRPHLVLQLTVLQKVDTTVQLKCSMLSGRSVLVHVPRSSHLAGLRLATAEVMDPELEPFGRPLQFVLPNGKRFRPGCSLAVALGEDEPSQESNKLGGA